MSKPSYNELQKQIEFEISKLLSFAEKMQADRITQSKILKDQQTQIEQLQSKKQEKQDTWQLRQNLQVANFEIKLQENKNAPVKQELEKLQAKLKKADDNLKKTTEQLQIRYGQINKTQSEIEEREKAMEEQSTRFTGFNNQIENLVKPELKQTITQIEAKNQEILEVKEQVEQVDLELITYKELMPQLQDKNQEIQDQLENYASMEQKLRQNITDIADSKAQNYLLMQEHEQLQLKKEYWVSQVEGLAQEGQEMESKLMKIDKSDRNLIRKSILSDITLEVNKKGINPRTQLRSRQSSLQNTSFNSTNSSRNKSNSNQKKTGELKKSQRAPLSSRPNSTRNNLKKTVEPQKSVSLVEVPVPKNPVVARELIQRTSAHQILEESKNDMLNAIQLKQVEKLINKGKNLLTNQLVLLYNFFRTLD